MIGKRIQLCREALGLTQEKFAEIVKLTPNYISAVERGVKMPSVETLIDIINGLGVSADEIFMDVIDAGYKVKASRLAETIGNLPNSEQRRIFSVVETLIKEANLK
jgi:transcriptional regulator with XRE-family HTH domain